MSFIRLSEILVKCQLFLFSWFYHFIIFFIYSSTILTYFLFSFIRLCSISISHTYSQLFGLLIAFNQIRWWCLTCIAELFDVMWHCSYVIIECLFIYELNVACNQIDACFWHLYFHFYKITHIQQRINEFLFCFTQQLNYL